MPLSIEEGLAERSRSRIDPSVMPAAVMETAMPEEHRIKTERPAMWRPGQVSYPNRPTAWGENYPGVNERVGRVFAKINALRTAGQPAIFFTSGEVALASMHESGFGGLNDAHFREGITTPSGLHIPGMTFENGDIVAYHDPGSQGRYTHMEIIKPHWEFQQPYQDPAHTVRTGMLPINGMGHEDF